MQTLKRENLTVGMRVIFVDRKLNKHDSSYVSTDRSSVPLDGAEGVVVYVNPRTDHDSTCASKTKTVKVAGKHWEGEGDNRKEVAHELEEHAGCDCGFRPGQPAAIALKTPHEKAHTCDGFVPMATEVVTTDKDGKSVTRTLYHGVWARPGHVYTAESYAAHKAAHDAAAKANIVTDAAKAKSIDIAKAYLAGDAAPVQAAIAAQSDAQVVAAADVGTVADPGKKKR